MGSTECKPGFGYDPTLGCRKCSSCDELPDDPHCDDCLSTVTSSYADFNQQEDSPIPLFEWQLIVIGLACGVVLVLAIAVFIRYTRGRDKTPRAMEHGISVDSLTGETMAVEESSAYTSSEMSSSGSSMAETSSILRETVI
ncbi:Hypp5172 [Branchiostoma lanceolatum]|uniref:Hypp5172 protein n=1 Tax=Branchiostoma lanceolatum TaxID=7740 RepID=A0A8K0AGV6_BRALA|nr:Hypp5172 [Branchiostoma lanceolatum]